MPVTARPAAPTLTPALQRQLSLALQDANPAAMQGLVTCTTMAIAAGGSRLGWPEVLIALLSVVRITIDDTPDPELAWTLAMVTLCPTIDSLAAMPASLTAH